ncbi:MAG: KilA-N domain-containing protein [Methanomassiliicoccaceae archaeon]|nr:KilA-N domain-containing protein [Methanomassiliicoccaceae archaeon]
MMIKNKTSIITVQDVHVTIASFDIDDYICITDMAKAKEGESRAADIIKNWIRNRTTLEFLGTWEMMHNPNFKVVEFDHFRMQAGLPTFVLSAKQWVEKTNAIGIFVQSGRYGGTYAHKDVAFEFGSAISPVFKLYLLKEYQRLKDIENNSHKLEWDAKRFLSRTNYLIHTDAVKKYVLPLSDYTEQTEWLAYADEADLLNVAMFGCTAKQWRNENPELAKNNNIRDFASVNELAVLSNLETHNAELIKAGRPKTERFQTLLEIARYQIALLDEAERMRSAKSGRTLPE